MPNVRVSQRDPAALQCINNSLGTVFNTKFPQNRSHVILDRLMANSKQAGNLLVTHAAYNTGKDFHFTVGKRVEWTARFTVGPPCAFNLLLHPALQLVPAKYIFAQDI